MNSSSINPDPSARHDRVLEDLDRQINDVRKMIRDVQDTQLKLKEPKLLGRYQPGWYLWPSVESLLASMIGSAEGRRNIIRRHSPEECTALFDHFVCAGCGEHTEWPCDDWRDAAGVEET